MKNNKSELLSLIRNQIKFGFDSLRSFCSEKDFAPNRISEILSGNRDCNVDTLFEILNALDIDLKAYSQLTEEEFTLQFWESEGN